MLHRLTDPFTGKPYDFTITTEKEARLFEALELALKDQCPPERKDYLCMTDESEEARCEECLLRWATLPNSQAKLTKEA